MVREFDLYSEGLGFKSQLDPKLLPSAKIIIHDAYPLLLTVNNIKPILGS